MPGKKSTSKSTRKIDAAEAVERMDRAAKREMSTPPKPYQQEPDRSVGSGKTTQSSVDKAFRRIEKAVNRPATSARPEGKQVRKAVGKKTTAVSP